MSGNARTRGAVPAMLGRVLGMRGGSEKALGMHGVVSFLYGVMFQTLIVKPPKGSTAAARTVGNTLRSPSMSHNQNAAFWRRQMLRYCTYMVG